MRWREHDKERLLRRTANRMAIAVPMGGLFAWLCLPLVRQLRE